MLVCLQSEWGVPEQQNVHSPDQGHHKRHSIIIMFSLVSCELKSTLYIQLFWNTWRL